LVDFFLVIWLLVSLSSAADLADEKKVIRVKEKAKYSLGILITEVEKISWKSIN